MKTLSHDQAAALTAIGQWLKDYEKSQHKQFLTLGGYAGTGKTTLLAALRTVLHANRPNLPNAGVRLVELAEHCTACRTDLFFSHRAEKGRTGRFGVVLGL